MLMPSTQATGPNYTLKRRTPGIARPSEREVLKPSTSPVTYAPGGRRDRTAEETSVALLPAQADGGIYTPPSPQEPRRRLLAPGESSTSPQQETPQEAAQGEHKGYFAHPGTDAGEHGYLAPVADTTMRWPEG